MAREAGLDFVVREGYAEASFTGDYGAARRFVPDLGAHGIEVYQVEATTTEECERLFPANRNPCRAPEPSERPN